MFDCLLNNCCLCKKTIIYDRQRNSKKEFCSPLRFGNSWNNTKVKAYQVVQTILYRLKTGCRWRELPMKQFFKTKYSWNSVYFHFQKWCKMAVGKNFGNCYLLVKFKSVSDLSTIRLDGIHTPVKRGGEAVEYQGGKKCKTSNMLILAHNNGIPIASSEPIAGNHNDSFDLATNFEKMIRPLKNSNIHLDGLSLNADAGFDTTGFREYCYKNDIAGNIKHNKRNGKNDASLLDDELYKKKIRNRKNQCLVRWL